MAEAILSDLAKKLLEGLGSLLLQEIGIASGVKKELRKLEESLSTINAILLDAEKKGAMNEVVKGWLKKLKDIAYDAEDVLDEFATEALRQKVELPKNKVAKQVRRCFSRSNPLVFRLKMGHRIKDLIERLDCIQKDNEIAKFQFKTQNVDLNMDAEDANRRHTVPFVIESEVLGREKDKENLIELLMESSGGDENVLVIPIIGIGGLGKTTLAQYVYNDERVKKHFDLRMWVCVSFDFDVVKLAKKIIECGDLEENQAKSGLVEKLSGKRYLLVLDDVWNDHPGKWDNLRTLLMVGAMKGSIILVTTRSEEVASIMQPIKVSYYLKELDENDCESLFNERAFGCKGKEANHGELVEIGKGIVKKCGGVPLAAKALGSLLRLKRNKNDWLNVLNTEIWNLAGEQEILPALRISYNQLPSHLKQCFAYCSLFPQDHVIGVDDLIHQWMAHGFISPPRSSSGGSSNSSTSLEDIGNRYFRELLWRSFFQEVEEDVYGNILRCKMHDLVHNLARWVAGLEWSEVVVLHSSPSSEVRHMVQSFNGKVRDHSTNTNTHRLVLEKPQKLRTLYVRCIDDDDYTCPLVINDGFIIPSLRGLRVLNLSELYVEHVPDSIRYLDQLRYLDLSGNQFKALPNFICRLYNLQTLILEECADFYEWPKDMTKMVSLRHLGLDMNDSLEYMPRGLGQLTSLRTLGIFVVNDPNNTRRIGGGLGELHGLNQLGGCLSIKGLGNVRDARDAEEAKLKEKSQLHHLEFHFGSSITNRQGRLEDEQVLGNLEPHPSLKGLRIEEYQGVKMPGWMINPSSCLLLSNLVVLEIHNCSNLKRLPLIREFPCLRTLTLLSLDALESIHNKVAVVGGEALPLFPSLEYLHLYGLPNLKRWTINPSSSVEAMTTVEEEEEEEEVEAQHNNNEFDFLSSMFPRLTSLRLDTCPKLTRVPLLSVAGIQHLTSLQSLSIDGLERLVSLPDCPAPATLQRLDIKNCPRLVRLPDRFFENLKLLSEFQNSNCSVQLISLPEGIQHLTALKTLSIEQCNSLNTLPESFGNLTALKTLSIKQCNSLNTLPESLGNLTALKTLSIEQCNSLNTLPESLGNLTALEQLSIGKLNGINQLPESLGNLTALQQLSISGLDGLNQLPESLGNLTALQQLSISYLDGLNQLPESLGNLTALQQLSISGSDGLNQLPESLGNLTALQQLYISDLNGLNQLPESLGNLTALEQLSILGLDGVNQLPESLGNLTALQKLSILGLDGINQLPESLGNLTALQQLSITQSDSLNQLPESLGNLTALQQLSIWELKGINQLPESLGNLTALQELSISGLDGLNQLPESLGNLTALQQLSISHLDGLNQLPESLGNLTALQQLSISKINGINQLPESLGNLTTLERLHIEHLNGINQLPESLGNLTALEELHIDLLNGINQLPESLGNLTALEELSISRLNGINQLPESLRNLTALQLLYITDCPHLSSLLKGIQHFTALNELAISGCPGLKALPEGFGSLSSLRKLFIKDCSNLSSLPKSLQHLTPLVYMNINNCPGLRALPDGLGNFVSRGRLGISDCPNLSS